MTHFLIEPRTNSQHPEMRYLVLCDGIPDRWTMTAEEAEAYVLAELDGEVE